jgi:FAD/FMN-containing dehydrogenase
MPASARSIPTFDELRGMLRGDLLQPGHPEYEVARQLWNGRFEPRPLGIVRCQAAGDVAATIALARKEGLPLTVRGGGHSYAGHSLQDGGLAVDLSAMRSVQVDVRARRATVGPGATWAEIDAATQAHGLAAPGPTVSTVGVGGYLLGGGSGYLSRRFGLGVDNLLAAEVVTAEGQVIRASDIENPDLFWAIRGGGGNFGVVTSLELRLHEVGPDVVTVQSFHAIDDGREVLRFYREFMDAAPDELNAYAFVLRTPPVSPFPDEYHGRPAVALVGCWCGDPAAGDAAVKPLAEFGTPFLAGVQRTPYVAAQQAFDAGMPKGLRWYSRAHELKALPDDAIDTMLRFTTDLPGPYTMAYLGRGGGAIGRVDPRATAYPHRDAPYALHIFPGWSDPSDDSAMIQWARTFHVAMATHATGGVYVNLLERDEADRVPAAYGQNYARLAVVKRRWDPDNVFKGNHNIRPGEA